MELAERRSVCRELRQQIGALKRRRVHQRRALAAALLPAQAAVQQALEVLQATALETGNVSAVDFRHSCVLLVTQFQGLLKRLASPWLAPALPARRRTGDEAWEDCQLDLEEALEDLERAAARQHQDDLLACVDLMEAVGRVSISNPRSSVVFHRASEWLDGAHHQFALVLRRRGVQALRLAPGDYPPVEQTRIAFRVDGRESERFVIHEILEQGYSLGDRLLRKATVSVVTQQEE